MTRITESQLRKLIRQEILKEIGEEKGAVEKKDAADVEKLKQKLDKLPLETLFTNINNPVEIAQSISYIIDKIVSTGGVDKKSVMTALKNVTTTTNKSNIQRVD